MSKKLTFLKSSTKKPDLNLEISMTSGVFTIAETVDAFDGSDRLMSARICQPNHKGGNISTPTSTFGANPYDTNVNLATTYSASSTVLNIDINSLAEEAQGRFSGYVRNGITLVGRGGGGGLLTTTVD